MAELLSYSETKMILHIVNVAVLLCRIALRK